ncbi:MAG TPA: tetratricopeptide repeat protein [Candidatus Binatia bacterium]
MKRRVTLEIHREDHKTDALGRVFLGATDRDETLALLRAYLGPQATLRHVELDDAVLRVEADVREFAEESRNLVAMARDLIRAGRVRSAIGQLEEALRLAPLGADALKALGRLYYRHRDRENARRYLTRAREVAPTDIEVLRLLAEIALHEDRRLAAREYLQQVLAVRPNDRRARTALARLQPEDAEHIRATLRRRAMGDGGGGAPEE